MKGWRRIGQVRRYEKERNVEIVFKKYFRKFVNTNLPQAGFEIGSLGPQAGLLPIEPPLLVQIGAFIVYSLSFNLADLNWP